MNTHKCHNFVECTRFKALTEFEAILKEASIVNCPLSRVSPLALNSITFTALPSIFHHKKCYMSLQILWKEASDHNSNSYKVAVVKTCCGSNKWGKNYSPTLASEKKFVTTLFRGNDVVVVIIINCCKKSYSGYIFIKSEHAYVGAKCPKAKKVTERTTVAEKHDIYSIAWIPQEHL